MKIDFSSRLFQFQYAWRGWILGGLFLILAWSRWNSHQGLEPIWLGLCALGAAYRMYTGRYLGSHSNGLRMDSNGIATLGPFRFGRHPLYLANMVTGAGLIFFAHSLPLWAEGTLLFAIIGHHIFLAKAEEMHLSRKQGEGYQEYLNSTSRWFAMPRVLGENRLELVPTQSELSPTLRAPMLQAWIRQGGNLGKTLVATLAIWALAFFHP